jgi:peptidoglycan pentaglycine glycine transferase (the first glycine)
VKIIHLKETHRNRWNRLVMETPESGFMQSWEWGQFKEAEGLKVLRLGMVDGDELIGGAMVYYVESSLGSSPLEIPHGPVLPWSDGDGTRRAAEKLHAKLSGFANNVGAPAIRMEPLISREIPHWPGALVRAPVDLHPTPTLIVDLDRSEEHILASMKPKGRYNIRLALKKGVEVLWSSDPAAVEDFYPLFELTFNRQDFAGEPRSFFINLVKSLGPMVRIYCAFYHGVKLAAAVGVLFGNRATYLYGGSLPFFRSAMAPYAMHWQMMRDARALGCRCYDLYGVAPPDNPLHPYAQFTQFKLRFGGRIVETTGAHDQYFYPRLADLWVERIMEAFKT